MAKVKEEGISEPTNPRELSEWLLGNWKNAPKNKIEYYYCKSGQESLARIATKLSGGPTGNTKYPKYKKDLTWEEITDLNFGTTDPKEVNWHLQEINGCRKTTQDRMNYMLNLRDKIDLEGKVIPVDASPWLWIPTAKDSVSSSSGPPPTSVVAKAKPELIIAESIKWHFPNGPISGIRRVYSDNFRDKKKKKMKTIGVAFREDVKAHLELKLTKNPTPGQTIKIRFKDVINPPKSNFNYEVDFNSFRKHGDIHMVEVTHTHFKEILEGLTERKQKEIDREIQKKLDKIKDEEKRQKERKKLKQKPKKIGLHHIALQASIPAEHSSSNKEIQSPNLAYPIIQHALFFLPGVLGSKIYVNMELMGAKLKIQSYPHVSEIPIVSEILEGIPIFGKIDDVLKIPLEQLACDNKGIPFREAIETEIFDKLLLKTKWTTVYDIKKRVKEIEKTFLHVYIDEKESQKLQHIVHIDIPYDWRLNIEESHIDIAQEIWDKHRLNLNNSEEYPFLALKVSIACHSTGGVIARGILESVNELTDLIEDVFFINVPFWGAPKAEYVYFSGDMEVPLVTTLDSFRQMAPDMPVVYYLSPNERYSKEVYGGKNGFISPKLYHGNNLGNNWDPSQEWTIIERKTRVEEAINNKYYNDKRKDIFVLEKFVKLNDGKLKFNEELAKIAENYVIENEKKKPEVKAYVFHSGGRQTVVATRKNDKDKRIDSILWPVGDGTVPTVSQIVDIWDWPNGTIMAPTEKNPEHTKAPNSPWIWGQIRRIFCHEDISDSNLFNYMNMEDIQKNQPLKVGTSELNSFHMIVLTDFAMEINDYEYEHQSEDLGAGKSKKYDQHDMDCGACRIQCKKGKITVTVSATLKERNVKDKDFKTLYEFDLDSGDDKIIGIEEISSTYDQINRVKIEASVDSKYFIDFVSYDK